MINTLTWEKVFLFAIVPLGQLFVRINYLNGSVDKSWTLFPLFLIPPFSFIPLIMMKLGWIKNGSGGKPYDSLIFIPIILKSLGDTILKSLMIPESLIYIVNKMLIYIFLYI